MCIRDSAEGAPFSRAELDALLDLAQAGCRDLTRLQRAAVDSAPGAVLTLTDGVIA